MEDVKNRLVRAYNPLTIYLFGSYAWGTPTEDSDLDLVIVVVAKLALRPNYFSSTAYHCQQAAEKCHICSPLWCKMAFLQENLQKWPMFRLQLFKQCVQ